MPMTFVPGLGWMWVADPIVKTIEQQERKSLAELAGAPAGDGKRYVSRNGVVFKHELVGEDHAHDELKDPKLITGHGKKTAEASEEDPEKAVEGEEENLDNSNMQLGKSLTVGDKVYIPEQAMQATVMQIADEATIVVKANSRLQVLDLAEVMPVAKHLPGKHDQSSHGGKKGSSGRSPQLDSSTMPRKERSDEIRTPGSHDVVFAMLGKRDLTQKKIEDKVFEWASNDVGWPEAEVASYLGGLKTAFPKKAALIDELEDQVGELSNTNSESKYAETEREVRMFDRYRARDEKAVSKLIARILKP